MIWDTYYYLILILIIFRNICLRLYRLIHTRKNHFINIVFKYNYFTARNLLHSYQRSSRYLQLFERADFTEKSSDPEYMCHLYIGWNDCGWIFCKKLRVCVYDAIWIISYEDPSC